MTVQVIDKGKPEDGMPGIADRQVPLGDHENMIPGLLNGQGSKVYLCVANAFVSLVVSHAMTLHVSVEYTASLIRSAAGETDIQAS